MTALAIAKQVAGEHGFSLADIRNPAQFGRLVVARRDAMIRLKQAGYSIVRIGMIVHRDPSTVEYHVYPKRKARKEARRRERLAS